MSRFESELGKRDLKLSDLPYTPFSLETPPVITEKDDCLTVGYVFLDNDFPNPLEDDGTIIFANYPEGRLAIADALALNSSNELDVICSIAVASSLSGEEAKEAWLNHAMSNSEFKKRVEDLWRNETNAPPLKFFKPYLRMSAQKEFKKAISYNSENIFDYLLDNFSFTEELLKELWVDKLESGEIGDFCATPLTVNCHNGTVSISDDYLNPQAIWYADYYKRDRITERAATLAFGVIQETREGWVVTLDPTPIKQDASFEPKSPAFESLECAFKWLEKVAEKHSHLVDQSMFSELLARGERRAIRMEASLDVKRYNEWQVADVYSVIWVDFKKENGKWQCTQRDIEDSYRDYEEALNDLKSSFLLLTTNQ